jgi:threonine dehydratase
MGVAYAARILGREATVVVPEWANVEKARAIEALGGRVVRHGSTMVETRRRTDALVGELGAYFADDGGDLLIAAGAGTVGLEMLEDAPDLQMLVIPMGDGALAGGCAVIAKALNPRIEIIGVQAEGCPALVQSWKTGSVFRVEGQTMADGLASVEPHASAVALLRRVLDDAVLVSDAELVTAIRLYLEHTHNLAEGAGAAGLAACVTLAGRLKGKRVGVILSGGNLDTRLLTRVMAG